MLRRVSLVLAGPLAAGFVAAAPASADVTDVDVCWNSGSAGSACHVHAASFDAGCAHVRLTRGHGEAGEFPGGDSPASSCGVRSGVCAAI